MSPDNSAPSARKAELLEACFHYVLEHGMSPLSLRPLAAEVGSSPRVLLYLFGSKDGLVRALIQRARADELAALSDLRANVTAEPLSLAAAGERIWAWLSAAQNRALLTQWVEAYGRSLTDPHGAWAGFGRDAVHEWLEVLSEFQPADIAGSEFGIATRTATLAVLRGALLDLLATGDTARIDAAVRMQLSHIGTYT